MENGISGNGLLFRFEGRYIGADLLPREILGPTPYDQVRFWTSYLRIGELFVYNGHWYQVKVNRLINVSDSVQRYVFFAVPERYQIREE
ncbi:MAG: hypothetical protein EBV07_01260 [Proteobacteria bacterium]|nr:hypothetical protein [Pseudomonadota bacterium]